MNKEHAVPITGVAITIAIALFIIAFFPVNKGLVVEGVFIDSGEKDPYSLFSALSKKSVFLISPQMHERAEAVDHSMFNGTALFLQVLEGNKRKPVQVIRVYNEGNELSYCLTNYGDVNKSETLEKLECLEYISQENNAVVLIQFPDQRLPQPVLEISEGRLVIKPKTDEGIGEACFLALRILFKNSQQIVERSDFFLRGLQGA